jgi:hypothetical protein
MAGGWVGLHDRPVRPALSRDDRQHHPGPVPAVVSGPTPRQSGPDTALGGPLHERDAPWQPNPAARPHPTFPLPPYRRGGRHLGRVAQDRGPLGQGRQAPVLKTLVATGAIRHPRSASSPRSSGYSRWPSLVRFLPVGCGVRHPEAPCAAARATAASPDQPSWPIASLLEVIANRDLWSPGARRITAPQR